MNTKSALEKLTDKQRKTLETNKTHLVNMRTNGNHDASIETRLYIRGYLDALHESEIITEAESRCLWAYATL